MKKIKKCQIVVLIILGIGGFWLFQNLWIFETTISQEEYQDEILGKWVIKSTSISESFITTFSNKDVSKVYFEFLSDKKFKRYCSSPCGNFMFDYESWRISGDKISIDFWYNQDKLISFSEKKTNVNLKN